jgi:hypothetical protein
VLSLVLIVLAAYAALTTFSRGVYLALIVVLSLLAWKTRTRSKTATGCTGLQFWSPQRWIIALILMTTMTSLVFSSGGYRGLMAWLGVVAVALAMPRILRHITKRQLVAGVLLGLMLGALLILMAGFLPKGPYLLHFSGVAALLVLVLRTSDKVQDSRRIYAVAGFFVLLLSAANVAHHWGGNDALWGMLCSLAIVLTVTLGAVFSVRLAWPDDLRWQGSLLSAAVAVSTAVAVFLGGGYMSERFSTSSKDLDGRFDHWKLSLSMLQTPLDHLFGKGLGRFPANYFFAIPESDFPATYKIVEKGGLTWLSLVGPRHSTSFGNLFRVSQRLNFASVGPFEVRLKFRANTDVSIHVEVCEKQLLYVAGCNIENVRVKAGAGEWQSASINLAGPFLSGGPWYAPRIKMFSLAIGNQSGSAEIDEVRLTTLGGVNLLANGDFGNDMQHWFISSDRDHMPWHAKNVLVNVLFDQGYVGLVMFLMLSASALWRLSLGKVSQHELAPYLSAAIVGFLVVGIFDSLIDVPRLAILYYLMILLSLSLETAEKQLGIRSREG